MIIITAMLISPLQKSLNEDSMRGPYRKTPSQERLKELFHYCPETGVFTRACDRKRWKAGQIAGTNASGYISINVDQTIYRAHRLAWVYMTGSEPENGIDHINGDGLDNRWDNLRASTQQENLLNKRVQRNNKLGVKGVCYNPEWKKYVASVKRGAILYREGFDTLEEATKAYNAAAKIIHGAFARLNSQDSKMGPEHK